MHIYLCNSIIHCGFQKIRCLLFNTMPYTKQTKAHTALNKQEIYSKVSQFCSGEEMGGKTTGRKRTGVSEFIIGTKDTCIFFFYLVYRQADLFQLHLALVPPLVCIFQHIQFQHSL